MRKKGPISLGLALDDLLRSIGLEQTVKEKMAVEKWDEVVGPYIAKVSKAERVENGVLYVKVINSTWKHQLFMLRREIINRLNDSLKFSAIREIVFIDSGSDFQK